MCTSVLLVLLIVQLSYNSSYTTVPATSPSRETRTISRFVLAIEPGTPVEPRLKCTTCGLVASSGVLLDSIAGADIDSNDCVFRMDVAPTWGYERHVGTKTTVRVISDRILQHLTSVFSIFSEDNGLRYSIVYGEESSLCTNCTLFYGYQKIAAHFKGTGEVFMKTTQAEYQLNMRRAKALGLVRLARVCHYWPQGPIIPSILRLERSN